MAYHTSRTIRGTLHVLCLVVVTISVFSMIPLTAAEGNATEPEDPDAWRRAPKCTQIGKCKEGMIIPMWTPQGNLSAGDKAARATVYFAALSFMFLGVSIIADRFMAAIEVITSKEREVTIRKPNGETAVMNVRIWNETVSNLTLMALGSSAPEIMLSIIEVCGNNFNAGDLGPGTIVGSAAFNLFIIIGLCVYVIPDGEVRRIKHLRVFFVTASWSVFAYLWMYLIISVISPGEVEIWEGIITFIFFPITVGTAYIADKHVYFMKFVTKRFRAGRGKGAMVVMEGNELEMGDKMGDDVMFKGMENEDAEVRAFERHRLEYMEILREVRKKNPNVDMKTLEEMAEYEVMNRGPKSRAFYRIQATRKLTGGGNVIKKKADKKSDMADDIGDKPEDNITRLYFEPGHYTVMENVGTFQMTVTRMGGDMDQTVYVDYRTEDGTANAGSDYEYAEGTIVFHPGDEHKQFPISIIDDDVFEEDEHFYVRLSNLRTEGEKAVDSTKIQLANPFMATIMILDDDHAGIFHFESAEESLPESVGEAPVRVARSSGARGRVAVPYRTVEGTAKGDGKDYEHAEGELIFDNDETEGFIKVRIIDDEQYEKNETFFIELGEPVLLKTASDDDEERKHNFEGEKPTPPTEKAIADMTEDERIAELGRPRLGEIVRLQCHIRESMEFKNTVDKLLQKANISLAVGTSSWREQFVEAVTVSAGDDDDDDGGEEGEEGEEEETEEKLPSCMDYVMHFLTIFWKVLFAFVPPTDYWNGWACFVVSLMFLAAVTAVIGDIASGFGCTINLRDDVNAFTFIALGTSLPDTFASKVAATGDPYADSSIGNVTGSNAVNVFLGIGIAWSIAAIVHTVRGSKFLVDPGSLAFSVTVFCVCALVAIFIMVLRRHKSIGGELGGPRKAKIATTCFFVMLWMIYVIFSSLESYCHIKGF